MINRLLKQSVTITPKSTYDKWGKPTAGTGVTAIARVQSVEERIQTAPDTFVTVRLAVWLGNTVTISNNDSVTHGGSVYKVVKVMKLYDIDGELAYIKVLCV